MKIELNEDEIKFLKNELTSLGIEYEYKANLLKQADIKTSKILITKSKKLNGLIMKL